MDEAWQARLTSEIRRIRKLAVLGVGNPDKGDDGAGPYCAGLLKRLESAAADRLLVIDGRDVPESQTGPLRRFGPDLTLIIDAAAGGLAPGMISIVAREKISDAGVSTHHIPLTYLIRYLEESIGSRVLVVGVEPATLEPGAPMTPAVKKAAETVSEFLLEAILT